MTKTTRTKMEPYSLNEKWRGLSMDQERTVFQLVDATHPLAFYLGVKPTGERLLLLVLKEEPPVIPDLRAVSVERFKRSDGRWSFVLGLADAALEPMFSLFCADLINYSQRALADGTRAFDLVGTRLAGWRKLFERQVPQLLSAEMVRGLAAELLWLHTLFDSLDERLVVQGWVGPLGADQDFQFVGKAWEVKAVRPGAKEVFIASENQLSTAQRQVGLVLSELLEVVDDGQSLNGIVEGVRQRLSTDFDSLDQFEEKLLLTGYISRKEYDEPSFVCLGSSAYDVTTTFPKLVSDNIPAGVSKVSYKIRIDFLQSFKSNHY